MNAQDLKNSILHLAIQGKIVEQREEEGSAKVLLEKIKVEKKQLIKEGKIKKQKKLPDINEDELPFDIPESWEWTRLSEIIDVRDGTHDTPKYVAKGVPLVTSKNLKQGEIDFDNVKLITVEDSEKINMRSGVDEGDILFAMIGSIGNPVLIKKTREFSIKNMALFKPINNKLFHMEYLLNFLQLEQESMKRKATGAVQSFVSLTFLRGYLVPLPPLEEQKRIVAKIEELLPYVDKYDVAFSEVEGLNKKFPEDMQKSILQYAIQGKLVEQREEDGTTEEHYIKIQEEKKMLIKEGKIKKTKALPEITMDVIPFDIPENWKWVRLGNIVSILGDGIHGTPVYDNSGDYYFINGNNLNDGVIKIKDDTKRVKEDQFIKHKRDLNENTVLVSINGTIGNVAFYGREKVILGKSACYFNLMVEDFKYYLYWVIKTKYFLDYAINKATGTTIKNVSLATMREFAIPLPPLEEQKRIVEKIQELLPYTKQLVK